MNRLMAVLVAFGLVVLGCERGSAQALTKDELKLVAKYDLSKIRNRGVGRGMNMFTTRDEIEMGQDMAEEIEANATLVKDPEVLGFVQQLGKRIVAHSDAELPMRFKVVESDEINAFALPNGVVYVTTGLLLASDSEAELAGVISHEIAHVAAHHGSRNDSKRQLLGFANLAVTMLSGGLTQAVAQPVMGFASMGLVTKFDREAEREADLLGLEYQYLSGYDPKAFISFLERLAAQDAKKSKWLDRMLASHPATSERIANAQRSMRLLLPPREDYIVDSSEFQSARERLAQLEARKLGLDLPTRPVLRKVSLVTLPGSAIN